MTGPADPAAVTGMACLILSALSSALAGNVHARATASGRPAHRRLRVALIAVTAVLFIGGFALLAVAAAAAAGTP